MDAAGDGIAAGALLVSGVSLGVAWLSDRHTRSAIRNEERDRREQIDLLIKQIEGEHGDRLANLDVRLVDNAQWDLNYVWAAWKLEIVNNGPASARRVTASIVNRHGTRKSHEYVGPIRASERSEFTLRVLAPKVGLPLSLIVTWEDGDGAHERPPQVIVAAPAPM
ncbi:MAG TPA: hypothetical protein VGH79_11565 [Gaiellaceae bacterium]|jgi:hypothetical protein